jgi:hypothetical protein
MGTLISAALLTVATHLGGSAVGGVFARFGVFGFGRKFGISRGVLKAGIALRDNRRKRRSKRAAADLQEWLDEHDPQNETGFRDELTTT